MITDVTEEIITLEDGQQIKVRRGIVTLRNGDVVEAIVEPQALARFVIGVTDYLCRPPASGACPEHWPALNGAAGPRSISVP